MMRRSILGFAVLGLVVALQPARAFDLSDFSLERSIELLEQPGADDPRDFSGVTMVVGDDGERRVFIIDNKTTNIYEYDLEGKYKRTIRSTGFEDTEGIAYLGDDKFAIVEERRAEISIVTIDANTKSIDKEDAQVIKPRLPSGASLNPDGSNLGLEGIAYDAKRNVLYVVKQKNHPRLYEVKIEDQPGEAKLLREPTEALEAKLDDLGGLHFDDASQEFFVISNASNRVAQLGPTGPCRSTLQFDGEKVEAVTLSPDGVDLVVVGEARQMRHYRRTPSDSPGETSDTE